MIGTHHVVQKFQAGEDIPEWLLQLIPQGPHAVRGAFKFNVAMDVIEAPDYFLVVPSTPLAAPTGLLDLDGTAYCSVMAMDKTVRVVHQEGYFTQVGGNAPVVNMPAIPGVRPDKPKPAPPMRRNWNHELAEKILGVIAICAGLLGCGILLGVLAVQLSQ